MLCHIRKHCVLMILLILVTTINVIVLYSLVISFLIDVPIEESNCDIVPLKAWSGSSSGHEEDLLKPVELVVVTHTVTVACDTDQECERIVNAIRNTQKGQGLNDIGQSFLVGGNGKIYEGAGWKVGTHTLGYSNASISLTFIGNFSDELPTEEALKAAGHFLGCFLNIRYLGCNYSVVGHRQLITTASPGDALQNHIKTWPHWTGDIQIEPQ